LGGKGREILPMAKIEGIQFYKGKSLPSISNRILKHKRSSVGK